MATGLHFPAATVLALLALATAPGRAQPRDAVPDANASPWLQRIAGSLQTAAHIGQSAVKCGDWTAGELRTLHVRLGTATRKLLAEDQHYTLALYDSGVAAADRDFIASPMRECARLRAENWLPHLRELAAGRASFWDWPG